MLRWHEAGASCSRKQLGVTDVLTDMDYASMTGQQGRWYFDAEQLLRSTVDDEFKFDWLLNRQVCC
jgi:hypothetical protein